ncbi:hypothetical protein CJF43_22225 [Pseudomonas fragi]|uniref:Immunity protein n=1 Tax=Pseudomonas fragi TaxID=296 RepID=A0A266LNB5_PSEFR|nr:MULTISPECIES: hypothetical protein [Pseudomonas]MCH4870158.1 hypothetical protein [Pseudomonas sp. TMW22089]NNB02162.1 hypothetical protein [Pseudomonas fragi]OZY39539.1 hypothetical protein CJF43_22225 [Pseudomonas fragi]
MSNINDVVANENPRDVILFIVRNKSISYPMVDMLYSGNSWVNIGNNLELLKLVHNMKLEGLIENSDGGIKKGPNWKEPAFMAENKYTLE